MRGFKSALHQVKQRTICLCSICGCALVSYSSMHWAQCLRADIKERSRPHGPGRYIQLYFLFSCFESIKIERKLFLTDPFRVWSTRREKLAQSDCDPPVRLNPLANSFNRGARTLSKRRDLEPPPLELLSVRSSDLPRRDPAVATETLKTQAAFSSQESQLTPSSPYQSQLTPSSPQQPQ